MNPILLGLARHLLSAAGAAAAAHGYMGAADAEALAGAAVALGAAVWSVIEKRRGA